VGAGVADETSFGCVAEQGLDDGEGDQFGVGQSRGDPDGRAFGLPLGMIFQEVIDGDVQSCREGVQVSVPPRAGVVPTLIMDAFGLLVVDYRAERANPLEPII